MTFNLEAIYDKKPEDGNHAIKCYATGDGFSINRHTGDIEERWGMIFYDWNEGMPTLSYYESQGDWINRRELWKVYLETYDVPSPSMVMELARMYHLGWRAGLIDGDFRKGVRLARRLKLFEPETAKWEDK